MSFPKYDRYKDSGVEWLEEVPEHWKAGALKHFVVSKPGAIKTGPFGSQLTSVEMQEGKIKVYNQRNVIDADFSSGDNYITEMKFLSLLGFETFPGDLLVTTRGTIGRAAILPANAERGILHPCVLRIQPDELKLNTHFLEILIQDSDLLKIQLDYLSNATTIDVIYSETMASVILPVPPLPEQRSIATFLDRETTKIDELIAEQQQLIDLLKEKRQAVISHAVTKGLNPDAPMKDSAIEWLGEVPEHWEVGHIKRLTTKITDGSHISPETENGVYAFISTKDVKNDSLDFDNCLRTSVENYEYLVRTGCKPIAGDVLFSKDGTIGRTVVIKEDRDFVVASSLIIISPDQNILFPFFLNYLCQSSTIVSQVECFVKGAGLPRLSIQNLLRIVGVFPPLPEQRSIAAFLDRETAKFDELIAETHHAIALLRERRTALISAAVTGKIDVRSLV